ECIHEIGDKLFSFPFFEVAISLSCLFKIVLPADALSYQRGIVMWRMILINFRSLFQTTKRRRLIVDMWIYSFNKILTIGHLTITLIGCCWLARCVDRQL